MQDEFIQFLKGFEASDTYRESLQLYARTEQVNRRTVDLGAIKLAYLEFGDSDAVPLIWAHGSCLTAYEIINVQAGLVQAGYRVIAIDYRGHGKTEGDFNCHNTSLYHIADDIAQLMDFLGLDKAVIGGLSKGGWIATAFYDAYPNKVMGLLLEDGGSFSHLRLMEELATGEVVSGFTDLPEDALAAEQALYAPSAQFASRIDGVKLALKMFAPLLKAYDSVGFITLLLSMFKQQGSVWLFHCKNNALMGSVNRSPDAPTLYSKLPIMQQTQVLMLPQVIFRNLHVPVHIIDPVSPTTELPVEHQNKELAAIHPALITHERYKYDYSPHGAHLQRPKRFIQSAAALMKAMEDHANA